MCVYSMVMDHYQPRFPDLYAPVYPKQPATTTITLAPSLDASAMAELRKLIDEFKQAVEAAKKVDALTGQPDCEDPEKAKLEDRVLELERRLDQLQPKRRRSRRRK